MTRDEVIHVGYTVIQPIPYQIERVAPDDYLASFPDGNIAIGGEDASEAYQGLIAEILDTFDVLTAPRANLSPAAEAQLAVLRQYIVRT